MGQSKAKIRLFSILMMICIGVAESTKADKPFIALSALTVILFFIKKIIRDASKYENNAIAIICVGYLVYCVYTIFYMCEYHLHL